MFFKYIMTYLQLNVQDIENDIVFYDKNIQIPAKIMDLKTQIEKPTLGLVQKIYFAK